MRSSPGECSGCEQARLIYYRAVANRDKGGQVATIFPVGQHRHRDLYKSAQSRQSTFVFPLPFTSTPMSGRTLLLDAANRKLGGYAEDQVCTCAERLYT